MRKSYTKVQYDKNGNKQCTNCGVYKNISEFHKYSRAQDKLKPWCKPCVKNYDLEEYNPKRKYPIKIDENGNLHCRNCGGYFNKKDMKQSKVGQYKGLSYCNSCSSLLGHVRNIKQYGITLDEYHDMLERQNYACKICGRNDKTYRKRLSIDHDHNCCTGIKSCGKCIRGLLCHHCNAGLGNFGDNIDLLKKAMEYLKQ